MTVSSREDSGKNSEAKVRATTRGHGDASIHYAGAKMGLPRQPLVMEHVNAERKAEV